ncbi:hypothetical protein [Macrococcus brunensis]|uniref:hypothetical protein n=1 Tax=Macrococcus brunensis TaxID=198483 RepID=UPI001AA06A3D|nr:hypothetical protein [Macrococcus brunensis]
MPIELEGLEAFEQSLESRFGREARREITDKALVIGAQVIVEYIKSQMESFADTGASINEITITEPMWIKGNRTVKIYWEGPKDRYRFIHLNERGHYDRSGKWVETKGKGAIDRAMRAGREAYFEAVKTAIGGMI